MVLRLSDRLTPNKTGGGSEETLSKIGHDQRAEWVQGEDIKRKAVR